MAKEGYVFNPATGHERELQNPVSPHSVGRIRRGFYKRGISGYDPEYPDMRGVFMARGPGNILILTFITAGRRIFLKYFYTKL